TRFSRDWSSDVCSSDLIAGNYVVDFDADRFEGVTQLVGRSDERSDLVPLRLHRRNGVGTDESRRPSDQNSHEKTSSPPSVGPYRDRKSTRLNSSHVKSS